MRSENVFAEKNVLPRDPEIETVSESLPEGSIGGQSFFPVVLDSVPRGRSARPVEYVPQDTVALTVSECVLMLLLQLVPGVGLAMDFVWSFSPRTDTNKRTVARAMLIVQCIVCVVAAVAWLAHR